MIPCRILVIAPYESMKNILLLICKDRPEVRLTVMVGDLGEGARLVQEINEEEFDIVISRGGTAEVLRSVVSIPVVEIQLSSYDVLSALKLAETTPAVMLWSPIPTLPAWQRFCAACCNMMCQFTRSRREIRWKRR